MIEPAMETVQRGESPSAEDPWCVSLERDVLLLVADVAAIADPETLSQRLVEGLRTLLAVRAVSIVGFEHRRRRPRLLASTLADVACTPAPGQPHLTAEALFALRRMGRVHRASALAARDRDLVHCLAVLDADWVVPLGRSDELAGLLVVAPKSCGGTCSPEEIDLLHRVSFQIAALVDGASLLEMANHDGLTGALRRGAALCLLEREIDRMHRYGRPLGLLMLDLDRFKRVNDRFGHLEGDAVLRRVAGVLSSRLRKSDLLGRYGGEEFLVILPETGGEPAQAVAEDLRQAIAAETVDIADGSVAVTVSVGATAAEGVEGGRAPGSRELLTAADSALYRAKRLGRNRVVFLPAPARLVTGPADRAT